MICLGREDSMDKWRSFYNFGLYISAAYKIFQFSHAKLLYVPNNPTEDCWLDIYPAHLYKQGRPQQLKSQMFSRTRMESLVEGKSVVRKVVHKTALRGLWSKTNSRVWRRFTWWDSSWIQNFKDHHTNEYKMGCIEIMREPAQKVSWLWYEKKQK